MTGFDFGPPLSNGTRGISVWPQIFKHKLKENQTVAILLVDTQALDSITEPSVDKDARIFAFSVMASSIQLYNVHGDIESSDLLNLDLYTTYGRWANKNKTLFQNLKIINRDKPDNSYPYPFESYGWQKDGKKIYFSSKENDPDTIKEQMKRFNQSYENIDVFYMPSPGEDVTTYVNGYKGDLNVVNKEFIRNATNLVESLFDPEKLLIKKVNGRVIKANQFIEYLKFYGKMLNSPDLPYFGTHVQNVLDISYMESRAKCLEFYEKNMQDEIKTCDPTNNVSYFSTNDLQAIDQKYKRISMKMFSAQKEHNSEEYMRKWEKKLEDGIKNKYDGPSETSFVNKNKENEKCFK
ncbi:atlastin-1-like, partial [Sitodiplosis mosellana]|uniref:atlastin-1-like n=1 Tax=Sitodiplosis mosellana TaxID=263140 RepID=UPI002443D5C0